MIPEKKTLQYQLDAYVGAYLAQQWVINGEEADEEAATAAVRAYMHQCEEYCHFISETFKVKPSLPQMQVFFRKDSYSDFSRRIYKAVLDSGKYHPEDEWKLFVMVYIGDLLQQHYSTQTRMEGK